MPILKTTFVMVEEITLSLGTEATSIGDQIDEVIANAAISPDRPVIGKIELQITPEEWLVMRGEKPRPEGAPVRMTVPGKRR